MYRGGGAVVMVEVAAAAVAASAVARQEQALAWLMALTAVWAVEAMEVAV